MAWLNTMLVLSRKVGQRILIGDQIVVTIVRVGQGGVRVGIEAPLDLAVVREELAGGDGPKVDAALAKSSAAESASAKQSVTVSRDVNASSLAHESDDSGEARRVLPR